MLGRAWTGAGLILAGACAREARGAGGTRGTGGAGGAKAGGGSGTGAGAGVNWQHFLISIHLSGHAKS